MPVSSRVDLRPGCCLGRSPPQCPLLGWALGSRLPPQLLSVGFHLRCPHTTVLTGPRWKPSCLGVSASLFTWLHVSKPPYFIFPFLPSLQRRRENWASQPVPSVGPGVSHVWFGGSLIFLLSFLRKVCFELRVCRLAACLRPAGEWCGSRGLRMLQQGHALSFVIGVTVLCCFSWSSHMLV